MEDDTKQTRSLKGGMLGVAALGLLGGVFGTTAYAVLGGNGAGEEPIPDDSIVMADTNVETVNPAPTVDGPQRMPAQKETVVEVETVEATVLTKSAVPGLKQAAFIVRFNKEDEKLNTLFKLYRSNKDASRKAFAVWAADHSELNGLSLQRVQYSGEVILAYTGADDPEPAANAKEVQARITSLPFVRYADPDYTAFPGSGE